MSRASIMIALAFCSLSMFVAHETEAPDYANAKPENGYQIAISPNIADGRKSDTNSASESAQSIGTYLVSLDLQALPVPASLLFIAVWLIGFKLTSQPSPALSRVEPSRYNKACLEMSMCEKSEPTSY